MLERVKYDCTVRRSDPVSDSASLFIRRVLAEFARALSSDHVLCVSRGDDVTKVNEVSEPSSAPFSPLARAQYRTVGDTINPDILSSL